MGRPKSKNPKAVHVGVRLDADMVTAVDAEVERLRAEHPGIDYTRSMIIRALIKKYLVDKR